MLSVQTTRVLPALAVSACALCLSNTTVWTQAAPDAVVINEVCYDPPGADLGWEYVELINTGSVPVDFAGYRLEFANGAVGPVWTVRWTGQASDVLAPSGLFLIADTGWTGPPAQAEVRLGLQNGPDAIRLVRADGSVDLVGWGALAWPELYEGRPHPGAAGASLARRPDGHDTNDNAADFTVAERTPGARNWVAFELTRLAVRWEPPSLLAPNRPLAACLHLANTGLDIIEDASLELQVGTSSVTAALPVLPAGCDTVVTMMLAPAASGTLTAVLRVRGSGAADTCRLDLGRVQVGPSEVRLSEVMAAPTAGGEWCELVNAGTVPRSLADLALRDEDGAWRALPDQEVAPGDCLLVAQDAAACWNWLQESLAAGAELTCDPRPPVSMASWPTLNNTAPPGRDFADRLYLGDRDGTVLDHVTLGLGSGRVATGRSVERAADLTWQPATSMLGCTPGCLPPPTPQLAAGELHLEPNPFSGRQGDGTLRIHLQVPAGAEGWVLRVFNLWGRVVRDLGGDDLGPGPRLVLWDACDDAGRSLAPGGYVAVVHWRLAGGGLAAGSRRLLVVREARP